MSIVSYAGPNLLFFFVVLERFWITGESHTLRFQWLVLFKTSPLLHCKSRIQSRKLLWKKRQKWGVPFYKLHSQKTNMKHNSFGLPFHFYCVLSTTVRSGKVNRNQCIFRLPSLFRCSLHHRPNVVDGGHCLCDFRRDFFAEFGPTEKKTYRKYTAMASRSIWTNLHKSISYIWDLNEWFKKLRSKSLETFQSLATKTMACNLSSFISLWINSTFPYIPGYLCFNPCWIRDYPLGCLLSLDAFKNVKNLGNNAWEWLKLPIASRICASWESDSNEHYKVLKWHIFLEHGWCPTR